MSTATASRRTRYFRFHFLLAGGLAVLGTVLLWFALSGQNTWYHWLACWLVTVNVLALCYYGYDKGRARSQATRVPEALLHTLTAAGGSVGAYAGMRLFRHKTVKEKFRILFWCIVTLQLLLAAWVVKLVWTA